MGLLNVMRDVCQRKDMRISGMTVGMSLLRNWQKHKIIIKTHKEINFGIEGYIVLLCELDRNEMGLSIIKC